jgi:hypothetical protein
MASFGTLNAYQLAHRLLEPGELESEEFEMKRAVIVLAVALATAGIAFAQQNDGNQNAQPPFGGPGYGRMIGGFPGGPGAEVQPLTVEGKLVFIDEYPALQAKDKTYMLKMPDFYYYAYTDNIREGAQMKIQGFVLPTFPGQDKPFVMVRSATIGSKTYDFSSFGRGFGGRGMMGGYRGGAQGGYGQRGGMMGGW